MAEIFNFLSFGKKEERRKLVIEVTESTGDLDSDPVQADMVVGTY